MRVMPLAADSLGVRSMATGQKRRETPHLAVRYTAPRDSTFWQS